MGGSWLAYPLTRGLDIDDPRTTVLRRQVIQQKSFLKKVYEAWYGSIMDVLPEGPEAVLELGSGAGFLKERIPGAIASEIFHCPRLDAVLDGRSLPFREGALRAVVMTDVFHHLPEPRRFLREAGRCVRPGGAVIMIEPWVSPWSTWVYGRLHHEPFVLDAPEWEFPLSGPLSGANGALPWIVFARDRGRFEMEFPEWRIQSIRPMMPFRYLLSGGVSLRSLQPGWTFPIWEGLEALLEPWMARIAMFARIVLGRDETETHPERTGP